MVAFPTYYASKIKTAPASPVTPLSVLTPAQIATQAASSAKAAIAPQNKAVEDQQAAAARQSVQDLAAIKGITTAADNMDAGIAPAIKNSYLDAAKEVGTLGQGFSTGMQDRVAAGNKDVNDFLATQGQSPVAPTVDPTALHDVGYGLGGFIPGSNLSESAANASLLGAGIVGANAATGRTEADARIAQEHTDAKAFQDKLTEIAATYPQLRDAALKALQSYNLQVGTYNENVKRNDAAIAHQQTADQISTDAEKRLEKTLDASITHNQHTEDYQDQSLKLRNKSYQLSVTKAETAGQKFDKNRSIATGHAVDVQGNDILDATGQTIPITQSSFKTSASNPYQSAVADAKTLRGKPVSNPSTYGGAYIAKPGATGSDVTKGVGNSPPTTSNPQKAQYSTTYTFAEAVQFLVDRRGITRKEARRALISGGWKPDGTRPKKKG